MIETNSPTNVQGLSIIAGPRNVLVPRLIEVGIPGTCAKATVGPHTPIATREDGVGRPTSNDIAVHVSIELREHNRLDTSVVVGVSYLVIIIPCLFSSLL